MVKLNKIYTRTGDAGTAGLVDGSRVSKSSLRMTAIGEVDEANAAIGVAIAALDDGPIRNQLLVHADAIRQTVTHGMAISTGGPLTLLVCAEARTIPV